MFHRPLFYIVSLYTCVTLSDFLIHKKFIFKLTKAPLQTIKKTIFSYITVTTSIGNVRMLAMTSSTSSTVSVQLMILSRHTSASLMLH